MSTVSYLNLKSPGLLTITLTIHSQQIRGLNTEGQHKTEVVSAEDYSTSNHNYTKMIHGLQCPTLLKSIRKINMTTELILLLCCQVD